MNSLLANGHGSVTHVPNLPPGFAETFTGRHVDTGDLRRRAVMGGDAPPVAARPRLAADVVRVAPAHAGARP
jgi:hypothetical protein